MIYVIKLIYFCIFNIRIIITILNKKSSYLKQDSINFSNSYLTLPGDFYTKIKPRVPSKPSVIRINTTLAEELNLPLDYLNSVKGLDFLSGSKIATGSEPIATVYAGHQFGHFSPQLGDGRLYFLEKLLVKEIIALISN